MESTQRLAFEKFLRELRRAYRLAFVPEPEGDERGLAAEVRLFALTFGGGFLFTSIFIA